MAKKPIGSYSKSLARQYLKLHDEVADLDIMIQAIVTDLAPELIARNGVGLNSAAQLLLTAGDNSERFRLLQSDGCGLIQRPKNTSQVE